MANKCANCGNRNIQHEVDTIYCTKCGKHSYEDDSGVVPDKVLNSGQGKEMSTPQDDGVVRHPVQPFGAFDPEPKPEPEPKAKAKAK